MKTLSEIYLPAELQLINNLHKQIENELREKKKISFIESEKTKKEEFLEYFMITEETISFHRRDNNKSKWGVKVKDLKDALKYALRTDEELSKQKFNKLYGTTNFAGSALYLFVNIVKEEINNRKLVGRELTHQTFGLGMITKIDIQKEFVTFKYGEETKTLSMAHFSIDKESQEQIKSLLLG